MGAELLTVAQMMDTPDMAALPDSIRDRSRVIGEYIERVSKGFDLHGPGVFGDEEEGQCEIVTFNRANRTQLTLTIDESPVIKVRNASHRTVQESSTDDIGFQKVVDDFFSPPQML